MTTRTVVMIACFLATLAIPIAVSAEDGDSSWGPPLPGVALKTGGGLYYSVPCGCVDRGLWDNELSVRLHFGWRGALEVGAHQGAMLLGGRFPSTAWSGGMRLTIPSEKGRWWEGISVRGGYKHWRAMGMRSPGTNGVYGALNWSIETFPHVYVEADLLTSRTFRVMPHWELGGRIGVSTRF